MIGGHVVSAFCLLLLYAWNDRSCGTDGVGQSIALICAFLFIFYDRYVVKYLLCLASVKSIRRVLIWKRTEGSRGPVIELR